jgi:hypothetical protein
LTYPILSPNPVFIVGNKRSGSTLLVNMLNEHPQLAITHESDIVWALYQCRQGAPDAFESFPFDAPRGLEALVASYGDALRQLISPRPTLEHLRNAFFEIQRRVIERGTAIHVPLKSTEELVWIGDKKPVQHASPELRRFILELFPGARFIHVIRHPSAVAASQQEAARTWPVVPDYWKAPPAVILDRWRIHEEWVLELKASLPGHLQTVRLEDLCVNPKEEMSKLFALLNLPIANDLEERLTTFVYRSPNAKYVSRCASPTRAAQRIMELYGYTSDLLSTAPGKDPAAAEFGNSLGAQLNR